MNLEILYGYIVDFELECERFWKCFLVFIFCNLQYNRLYIFYVVWLNQGICYGDVDFCVIYVYICVYFCVIIFFYNVLILLDDLYFFFLECYKFDQLFCVYYFNNSILML